MSALRTRFAVVLVLAAVIATMGLVVPPIGSQSVSAAPVNVLPPSRITGKYVSDAQVKQQGDVALPACTTNSGHHVSNVDGRDNWAEWWVESSIGSGSVIPVGTEIDLTVRINSPSPDQNGDDGPYFNKLRVEPAGPVELVGLISQEYIPTYNFGSKNDTLGLYFWSGDDPKNPWGIGFSAYSGPGILKPGDGVFVTYKVRARATEPGVIALGSMRLTGRDGANVFDVDDYTCEMAVPMSWTVVEALPIVAGETANTDARYPNVVPGDATTGAHAVAIDVLDNDDDTNLPGGPGDPSEIRLARWDATSEHGGTVTCGTDVQQDAPSGAVFSTLSSGPCRYTPPVGFDGVDTFEYVVRSASTLGERVATATVIVEPNRPPIATDVVAGAANGQDLTLDVAGSIGDVDGDPITCAGNGAPSPVGVGTATVHADCTIDWDNTDPGFIGTVTIPYLACDTHATLDGAALGQVAVRTADYAVGDLSASTSRRCTAATAELGISIGLRLPPTGVTDIDVVDAWYSSDGQTPTRLSIPVLANDIDGNGPAPTMPSAALAIVVGPPPQAGTAMVVGDRIEFVPADGFFGPIGITYRVCEDPATQAPPYVDDPDTPLVDEGLPFCGLGTVIIGVFDNVRPVAGTDVVEMLPTDTITGWDLAANDFDPDGTLAGCLPGSLSIDQAAKVGSATLHADCTLDLDPVDDAAGPVDATYTVCDSFVLGDPKWEADPYAAGGAQPGDPWPRCRIGQIHVELLWDLGLAVPQGEPGSPPQCVADAASTARDTPVPIAVLANDSDDDTWLGLVAPSPDEPLGTDEGGTWHGTDDLAVYVPAAGFVGMDTFEYTAIDQDGQTCVGTVSVDVTSDQAPTTTVPDGAPTLPPTGGATWLAGLAMVLLGAGLALRRASQHLVR